MSSSRNSTKSWLTTKKKRSKSRNMRKFSRILGWRQKKPLHLKKCANFHELWGETTKKRVFITKLAKKQSLLTNFGVIISILGVSGLQLHSSGTEPVTFLGAQSSLGRHNSYFGGTSSDSGGTASECPRGVGPAASLQQFIELSLSHFC